MKTLNEKLKSIANLNGKISLDDALRIAKQIDDERLESQSLLKRCARETGMVLGEEINKHLAAMDGTSFSSKDYHSERMPEGQ